MNISLIMLVVYLIVTLGISMGFARQNAKGDTKQFALASGGLGVPLIVSMLFSELIAGSGTIGNAASAFQMGFSSVWANWGMALGCILFVLLVARFYRAMGISKHVISVPEAYEHLFDFRCRMVLLVIVVVVYGIIYSTQAVAAASVLAPLTGVEAKTLTWVLSGLFILLTVTGGMKGVAWMNVIHAIVMYCGMAFVAFKSLSFVGGIEMLRQALPAHYFSFAQPDWPTTLASALGTALSFLAAATVVNATLSAKSSKAAGQGIIMAALLVIPFALAPAVIGMCAKVVMPEITANSALFTMAESLGSVYGGLISMAIIAAIWSTAPALLLIVCTTISRDFYKGLLNKDATDRQQLKFIRIAAVVIGLGGNLFGLHAGSILNQMLGAFQIRSVAGIVLVIAIYWPRVSKDAAFWSMLVGGLVAAVWHFSANPWGIAPLWPAAGTCLLILIALTLRSHEKVSPGYQEYQKALALFTSS